MTIMAAFTPKARALVEAGRSALQSSQTDRQRVAEALRAQLGPAALPQLLVGKPAVVGTSLRFAPHIAAGICFIGGVAFFALRPDAAVQPTPSKPAQAALVAPGVVVEPPSSVTASPSPLPPAANDGEQPRKEASEPSGHPQQQRQDFLAQEVALLSRATSALRAGRPADALKALDEHQRKFSRGVLSEERRAAKAQALCLLGRTSEGRAELGHLAAGSPAAARAEQVCSKQK
jgi:hypothetical protein